MKRTVMLTVVIVLLVLVAVQRAFAQERVSVRVKGSEVVTGVVIVSIVRDGKAKELQCNQGAAYCTLLKSGTYGFVELPENYGMYLCKNVEIYREDKEKPEEGETLGKYCLVEK